MLIIVGLLNSTAYSAHDKNIASLIIKCSYSSFSFLVFESKKTADCFLWMTKQS